MVLKWDSFLWRCKSYSMGEQGFSYVLRTWRALQNLMGGGGLESIHRGAQGGLKRC